MYRKILVPLDGSPFGERALPMAVTMAKAMQGQLVLVRAAWATIRPGENAIEAERKAVDETEAYLAGVAQQVTSQGIQVEMATPYAAAAEGILVEIAARKTDLVIMCTHGRSGLGRWVYGSVAEAVLAKSPVPVLLVRPTGATPRLSLQPGKGTVLVPLDGSAFGEASLPHATAMARTLGGRLVLLRVVTPSLAFQPELMMGQAYSSTASERILEEEQKEAESYLGAVAGRLKSEGVPMQQIVQVGWPAETTIEEARKAGAELIVMATHGRTGLAEVLLGSVAMELIHRGTLPLLLVRPPDLK